MIRIVSRTVPDSPGFLVRAGQRLRSAAATVRRGHAPDNPESAVPAVPDRTYRLSSLSGATLSVKCPPWCTYDHTGHVAENAWHEAEAVQFIGPGDFYGHFDNGEPYDVMWACISAQPDDETGEYGRPYIYFDTLGCGQGGRLDVAGADKVLADLRAYTARLQQMRDQLAEITRTEGEQQ